MTLRFAAEPFSKNGDLLKDLQEKVSSGKVGDLSVDSTHILNVEPEVGKIFYDIGPVKFLFNVLSLLIKGLLHWILLCMKGTYCKEIIYSFNFGVFDLMIIIELLY